MSIAGLSIQDLAGIVLGFILTIMVFSYLIGDNPFFRLAIHIFIGVAAGFAVVVVIYNVILNQLLFPIIQNPLASLYLAVPPIVLGLWLFTKVSPRLAWIGNPVMAYLVGVAAATAIGGAVIGTLFPQIGATTSLFILPASSGTLGENILKALPILLKAVVILAIIICTMLYFYFGVKQDPNQAPRRPRWIEEISWLGQIFVAVTYGVLFAGVYSASLAALIERVRFLLESIVRFVPVG